MKTRYREENEAAIKRQKEKKGVRKKKQVGYKTPRRQV